MKKVTEFGVEEKDINKPITINNNNVAELMKNAIWALKGYPAIDVNFVEKEEVKFLSDSE